MTIRNPLVAAVSPSLIRSLNARKRPGDIDLGLGEPTLPPPIAPFEAALEWTRRHGSPYSPNAGFGELRASIAAYLNPVRGSVLSAENVCVTNGSEEALYLAIKSVVDPNRDDVLIVEPCYLAYAKLCVLEGIRHRMVPLSADDGFQPSAQRVLDEVRPDTRLIILNTPSNPTGRIWSEDELEALATGLSALPAGQEVYVLTDEVYREIYFGEAGPPSIATHYARTMIAGSLSKCVSMTGLRLGWLAAPPDVIEGAIRVHQYVNTAASTFAQRVAIDLLQNPESLGMYRAHYRDGRADLLAAAAAAGLDLIPPDGAFYGFVRLTGTRGESSMAFAERLLDDKRVVAIPGVAFGDSGEGWLRLSWVAPPDHVAEGLHRIGAMLKEG